MACGSHVQKLVDTMLKAVGSVLTQPHGVMVQLYTQDFYRDVVKPKLNPDGIFVTQSGPAGVLSSTEVFTAINKTLQSAFPTVVPYAQHIPSYNDAWVSLLPCLSSMCASNILPNLAHPNAFP